MLKYKHMAIHERPAVAPTTPPMRVGSGKLDVSALGEEG